MTSNTFGINEKLATSLIQQKKTKLLWAYCVVGYLVSGVGKEEKTLLIKRYAEFTSCSEKTAYNHINALLEAGYVTEREVYRSKIDEHQTAIFVKSKGEMAKEAGFRKGKNIKFEEYQLKDYSVFRDHYICVKHLFIQNSFRHSYNKLKKNTLSLLNLGKIEEGSCPSSIDKVGCSIRKVCQHTGIDYLTVQRALKGNVERTYNVLYSYDSYSSMLKDFNLSFFKQNVKYRFFKNKEGGIDICYSLGSVSKYNANKSRRQKAGGGKTPKPSFIDCFFTKLELR